MAPTLKAKSSFTVTSSGTTTVVPAPVHPTTGDPVTLVAGDRILFFVASVGTNPTVTAPAGLLPIGEPYSIGTNLKTALFYRDVPASPAEPSSYTFTWSASGRTMGIALAYSGSDMSRAPSAANGSGPADSAAGIDVPSTAIVDGDWQVTFTAARENPGTASPFTWSISDTSDAKRFELTSANTATGAQLTGAAFDSNRQLTAGSGGGSSDSGNTILTNKFVSLVGSSGSKRLGATLKQDEIPYWEPKLMAGGVRRNEWMRVFPNGDGQPPDWEDSRIAYIQRCDGEPFLSSKLDGNAAKLTTLSNKLKAMPSWLLNHPDPNKFLWITDRHEPEGDVTVAAYRSNIDAFCDMIEDLPSNIKARIKYGPVLTRQWTENTSGRSYGTHDTGRGNIFGVDMYGNSWGSPSTNVVTTFVSPASFLAKVRTYADASLGSRLLCFPEIGYIGAPSDPTSAARAAWLQGIVDITNTWADFAGMIWWNAEGKAGDPVKGVLAGAGIHRWFHFDRIHNGQPYDGDPQGGYDIIPNATSGGGGGSGGRVVTPSKTVAQSHAWSVTLPSASGAPPVVPTGNPMSTMGRPIR